MTRRAINLNGVPTIEDEITETAKPETPRALQRREDRMASTTMHQHITTSSAEIQWPSVTHMKPWEPEGGWVGCTDCHLLTTRLGAAKREGLCWNCWSTR